MSVPPSTPPATPDPDDAFRDLMFLVASGEATPAQRTELDRTVAATPQRAHEWEEFSREYADLGAALRLIDAAAPPAPVAVEFSGTQDNSVPPNASSRGSAEAADPTTPSNAPSWKWWLAAAALLALAGTLALLQWRPTATAAEDRLLAAVPADSEFGRYLRAPWSEAAQLAAPRINRGSDGTTLRPIFTPQGEISFTAPIADWRAEAGETFRVVLRRRGETTPLGSWPDAAPPLTLPALEPGASYELEVRREGARVFRSQTRFSIAETPVTLADSEREFACLLGAAQALAARPARPADALQWLARLPATTSPAGRDWERRLRLWTCAQLGLQPEHEALLREGAAPSSTSPTP